MKTQQNLAKLTKYYVQIQLEQIIKIRPKNLYKNIDFIDLFRIKNRFCLFNKSFKYELNNKRYIINCISNFDYHLLILFMETFISV